MIQNKDDSKQRENACLAITFIKCVLIMYNVGAFFVSALLSLSLSLYKELIAVFFKRMGVGVWQMREREVRFF